MPAPHLRVLLADLPPDTARDVAAALVGTDDSLHPEILDSLAEGMLPQAAAARGEVLLLGIPAEDAEALDRVRDVRGTYPDHPLVVLVPGSRQHLLLPALRAGAQGAYVLEALDGASLARVVRDAVGPSAADRALRLSPEELRALVEGSPLPIVALDREGRVKVWNRACETMFGWTAEEALGEPIRFVPPDRRDEYEELLARALAGETMRGVEVDRVRRDGSPIHVRLWVAPLRDHRGAVRGLLAVCEDVSDRKQMQAELEQSEARFRSLFEESMDGILLTVPDGRILSANPAACRMLGYTEAELVEVGRQGLTDPADPRLPGILAERRRTGAVRGEITMIHRDGRRIPVELSSRVFVDARGEERSSLFLRDATERHLADRRSRVLGEVGRILGEPLDPHDRVRRLAGIAVPLLGQWCVIVLRDREGRLRTAAVTATDPAREAILHELLERYPYGEGRGGRLVEHVLHTRRSLLLSDVTDDVLAAAAQDDQHLEILRRLAPATTMVVPLAGRERTLGAILVGSADPSHRYDEADLEMAEELAGRAALVLENAQLFQHSREARTRAEAAMRARDDVLGIVAHDLRSPLGAISMCAHLLEEQGTSEGGRPLVRSIARAAEQMDCLIRDLLEVTRIEAGELRVEAGAVPAATLLREALESLPGPAAGSATVRWDVEEGLPSVRADAARVQQVFSNLVGNALKFTPADGSVTVRAVRAEAEVRFLVTDTGPGIAPGDVPRLFDRFYQAQGSRRAGTGLGLAIVKGIVEAHGGRVGVETAPGRGSTFWFTLPAAEPAPPEPARPGRARGRGEASAARLAAPAP